MELPTVLLAEKQDVFDTRFRRFVREKFPALELVVRQDGAALRYEMRHEGGLIAEVDTLPLANELEIRVARPRAADGGFCEVFCSWVRKTYQGAIRMASAVNRATSPVQAPFTQWLFESLADEQDDDPERESLRQRLVDTARRRLPLTEESVQVGERVDQINGVKMDLPNFERFLAGGLIPLPDEPDWKLAARPVTMAVDDTGSVSGPGWAVYWTDYTDVLLGYVLAVPVGDTLSVSCYDIPHIINMGIEHENGEIETVELGSGLAQKMATTLRQRLRSVGALATPTEALEPARPIRADGGKGSQFAVSVHWEQLLSREAAIELAVARRRAEQAQEQVTRLRREYNDLARGGADPDTLQAKMAEIKAAEQLYRNAREQANLVADKQFAVLERQAGAAQQGGTRLEIVYPYPLAVLDAAIKQNLPGYAPGFVEFERIEDTYGSVVYRMWQDELGGLGALTVRQRVDQSSVLEISHPPRPKHRDLTSEELAAVKDISNSEERRQALATLMKEIYQERDDLYERRQRHQQGVIRALFSRMRNDPALVGWRPPTQTSPEAPDSVTSAEAGRELPLPAWLPKTSKTRAEWREAYLVITQVREEYRQRFLDGGVESPKATVADYQQALVSELNWQRSAKVVRWVERAGDNGWLD